MAKGRPPKAPALRIADGTHRNDRHGAKEAYGAESLLTQLPAAPGKKRAEFKRRWLHYVQCLRDVGQLTTRDLQPLEALCDAHQDEFDAREALREFNCSYYPTMQGVARHPAWQTIEKARAFIQSAQLNMGFSPAGRAKIPPSAGSVGTKKTAVQGMNRKV